MPEDGKIVIYGLQQGSKGTKRKASNKSDGISQNARRLFCHGQPLGEWKIRAQLQGKAKAPGFVRKEWNCIGGEGMTSFSKGKLEKYFCKLLQ